MGILKARVAAVSAAAAALVLAGMPAFAADAPGALEVQGWSYDYTANGRNHTDAAKVFSSIGTTASGSPLVGTTMFGRVNGSTGLYYPKVTKQDGFAAQGSVSIHAPVAGTTGVPTLTTSAGSLQVRCTVDAEGNPDASVKATATVPHSSFSTMPVNHTVVVKNKLIEPESSMTVVYNEQKTLPDGRLQVVGMHVKFDVKDSGLAGSGPVTGDIRYGIVTCGKVTNAEETPVPLAPAGLAGGVLGLSALIGGGYAVRRRTA